ncbi:hypothetical protein FQZ97_912020 [compost metagenome]
MHPHARQTLGHAEHGVVFADQRGAVGRSEVDELLVVTVLAGVGRLRRFGHEAGAAVEGVEHILRGPGLRGQAARDLRVGQHAHELLTHRGGGQPFAGRALQRLAQRRGGRILENEKVERDVGVEHQHVGGVGHLGHAQASGSVRGLRAVRSKRNSRHSMGPFHSGTRRDSLKRILPGSLRSGVSSQALQPA